MQQSRRTRIRIIGLAAAILAACAFFFATQEPSYGGKSLSAWLEELDELDEQLSEGASHL